jgi:hypothetical protein
MNLPEIGCDQRLAIFVFKQAHLHFAVAEKLCCP